MQMTFYPPIGVTSINLSDGSVVSVVNGRITVDSSYAPELERAGCVGVSSASPFPYGKSTLFLPCAVATTNTLAPQDVTGNGMHTTLGAGLTAAACWATAGFATLGGAANQYFQEPLANFPLDLGKDCFCIAMQINIAAPPSSGTPMFIGTCDQTSGARGWYLGVNTSGIPRLYVKDQSSPTSLLGGGQIADGSWHTLVAAFDGPNKSFFAWVDGILQVGIASGAWAGDPSNTTASGGTNGLTFGAQTSGATSGIASKLKNIAAWRGGPSLPANLNALATAYNTAPGPLRAFDMVI
jgi:hypothetical protein